MTDRNKFEEMLERLVNEDRAGAEELFHEIVVEKSRDIYESLLAEEAEEAEVDEATDEEVDESEDELDEAEDDDLDESDDEDLDEADEEVDESFFGEEDPADDLGMDIEMPDMGMEPEMGADDMGIDDEGEGDVEDRLTDIEDMLDELKAEFDAMMAGEEGEDHGDDMDDDEMPMDMDSEEGDDEGEEEPEESFNFEASEEEVEEAKKQPKSAGETMREYVEKVTAKMGDNGQNTKSTVAGKNDMGGTAANIARGDVANDPAAGAGSKVKGSALNDQNAKEANMGNVNVPGGKASKSLKAQPAGHGAEKKGKPESADKAAGSMLNGAPKRAK